VNQFSLLREVTQLGPEHNLVEVIVIPIFVIVVQGRCKDAGLRGVDSRNPNGRICSAYALSASSVMPR
jgi:hypothetical protein